MNKELFTQGEWVLTLAKWTAEAPTGGFHIKCGERSICGLNVNTDSHILPKEHDWFREDIHITPQQVEADAALISQAPAMYRALKEILLWTKVKNGRAEFKTSSEQIEEFKSILQKANPPQ